MQAQTFQERFYRTWCKGTHLIPFQVAIKETDLWLKARRPLINETKELVFKYRAQLEKYISLCPGFKRGLSPLPYDPFAPKLIKNMMIAGKEAGVGPMAAVAGAIAQATGKGLLQYSEEIIVENGGDIFIYVKRPIFISIFAGSSQLSNRLAVRLSPSKMPIAVCTSSATIGHSLSQGKADAVTVVAHDAALADASATAICNLIKTRTDIEIGISFAKKIKEILGVLIILKEYLAAWGQIKLIPIKGDAISRK
jgi:ApbE superfamily uncharacterized protein (UPF0280 family)